MVRNVVIKKDRSNNNVSVGQSIFDSIRSTIVIRSEKRRRKKKQLKKELRIYAN